MELLFGFVDVVRTTAELDVLDACGTAGGVWLDVVKLKEAALGAAAVRADESAPALVAPPDGAAYDSWSCRDPAAADRAARGWAAAASFRALEIPDEQREGPLEDGGRVTAWNRMAQQILRASELVVHVAATS